MQSPEGNLADEESAIKQEFASAHTRRLDAFSQQLKAAVKKQTARDEARLRGELEAKFTQEKEGLVSQHQAAAAEWKTMLAQRNADSKQFAFSVRGGEGPHVSGSIPRHIFLAEPDSALAHIYNGEWQYAVDESGRALINSNPEHWPIILDWLSFGARPAKPTPAFIAECEHWRLSRLLAAMEPKRNEISLDPGATASELPSAKPTSSTSSTKAEIDKPKSIFEFVKSLSRKERRLLQNMLA